jgi:hypothetical protein
VRAGDRRVSEPQLALTVDRKEETMAVPMFPAQTSRVLCALLRVVAVVAVAAVCLKRAAASGSLAHALRSPWTLAAVALYLVQVTLFVVSVNGWNPSVVGTMPLRLEVAPARASCC